MKTFFVCIHDATPAFAPETRIMIRDLAPLIGRRLSLGVVPNWHGEWPLTAHPDYCRMLEKASDELLLHGYFHRRRRGWGPTSVLAEGSDEMNGLDREETRHLIVRGQSDFIEIFGGPARGFLAPAWRTGHVRTDSDDELGLDHIIGFFSLESRSGMSVPLATWTWDCGRWSWLGHVGHGIGHALQSPDRIPTLAIHPRDVQRGFWPEILLLVEQLLDAGREPVTAAELLAAREC